MSAQKPKQPAPNQFGFGPRGGPGMMGAPVQKAKQFKPTLWRLIGYLSPYRYSLFIVLLTAILSTVFSIVGPKIMGKATTKLFEGMIGIIKGVPGAKIDFTYIGTILLWLVGLYLISALFGFIQQYVMAGVAQKTIYQLRKDVNEKLARLPLKYYDTKTHGELLSRAVNDIDNISTTLQQSLTQFLTSIVTLIGVIVMMLTISPWLTLITVLTLPLSFIGIAAVAKRSQAYFKAQQASLGELNGHIEEMYTGHPVVKAFNREQQAVTTFEGMNDKLYRAGWRAQFISGIMMPMMMFIGNVGYVMICVVGGILVLRRSIEIGDVQAFISYSKQFTQPITQTAQIANVVQSTIASAERVFEVLDEEEEIADPEATSESTTAISANKGHVQFNHVKFGYDEHKPIIHDLTLDVHNGQTIAIVGPTGAGKTTLINLLMRFYDVQSGQILIDGQPITALPRHEHRTRFGMVLQDTWLFNGSIYDNIAYGKIGATEEEVYAAARAANADHFIRTLPEGYNTELNEEASNISQGQKQLLTIARAMLANPLILILDEATSNVDTRTEVHIQKAMTELMKTRTSFVIAHRLSTIKDADLILVMNQGTVIEQGSHEQLLSQNGFYAELYQSQFQAAQ